MKDSTFCLCMIVKDEAHVIRDLLASVANYLNYWVICDTGSSDDTPKLIEEFFQQAGIAGELHRVEWRNFGFNRTQVFNLAYKKADYLWVIDADDFLVGKPDLSNLTADAYRLKYVLGSITYYRDQIFKGDLHWEYKGVLHEYPFCNSLQQPQHAILEGDYYIQARTMGARSKIDPKVKYLADAALLEQALTEEKDSGLVARYLFYLAQSYRDADEPQKAIAWYQKRVDAEGWVEEVWYSKFQIGKLWERLGEQEKAKQAYLAAFEYRPSRAEALHSLGRLCNIRREFNQAYLYLSYAVRIPHTQDILFVTRSVYEYEIVFELSVSAYWVGEYKISVALCDRLIAMKDKIHAAIYEQTVKNRRFGMEKLSGEGKG